MPGDVHLDLDVVGAIAAELYAKHLHLDGSRDHYMVLHLATVYGLLDNIRDTLGERLATETFLKLMAMASRYETDLLISPRSRQNLDQGPPTGGGGLNRMKAQR